MKNKNNQAKIIVVICAVIGFALFIIGCPANPTQNSGNNSNRNTANVANKAESSPELRCSSTQCTCSDGTCKANCDQCPEPPPTPNTNNNANSNSNANSNANVR